MALPFSPRRSTTAAAAVVSATCIALLAVTPSRAQDTTLLEGFADGFLFHYIFAKQKTKNSDGSITYWKRDNPGATTVRQSPADPCVFHVTMLNLNTEPRFTPVVLIENIYDLRGITFEELPKPEFTSQGGSYYRMQGKKVQCDINTFGSSSTKVEQKIECRDIAESTVEPAMLPILRATAPKLRQQCKWK
jgi:hypothetical protein